MFFFFPPSPWQHHHRRPATAAPPLDLLLEPSEGDGFLENTSQPSFIPDLITPATTTTKDSHFSPKSHCLHNPQQSLAWCLAVLHLHLLGFWVWVGLGLGFGSVGCDGVVGSMGFQFYGFRFLDFWGCGWWDLEILWVWVVESGGWRCWGGVGGEIPVEDMLGSMVCLNRSKEFEDMGFLLFVLSNF